MRREMGSEMGWDGMGSEAKRSAERELTVGGATVHARRHRLLAAVVRADYASDSGQLSRTEEQDLYNQSVRVSVSGIRPSVRPLLSAARFDPIRCISAAAARLSLVRSSRL